VRPASAHKHAPFHWSLVSPRGGGGQVRGTYYRAASADSCSASCRKPAIGVSPRHACRRTRFDRVRRLRR